MLEKFSGINRPTALSFTYGHDKLEQWLALMEMQFASFILPVTPAIAKLWGRLCVRTGNKGIDNLIAATALCHNLIVVTRNMKDFEPSGVRVFDPFGLQEAGGTAG